MFKTYRPLAFGNKVGVDELRMANLITRVLVDITRHVLIQRKQSLLKCWIAQGYLVVLLPQVRFQNFCCRQKSQDRGIPAREVPPWVGPGHTPAVPPAGPSPEHSPPPPETHQELTTRNH